MEPTDRKIERLWKNRQPSVPPLVQHAKRFFLRVAYHCFCFAGAIGLASAIYGLSAGDDSVIPMYFGFLCIFGRGSMATGLWAVGLLQAAVMMAIGLPLFTAVLWGGAQSWLQRAALKRFSLAGGEWVAFTMLFLCLTSFFYVRLYPDPLCFNATLVFIILALLGLYAFPKYLCPQRDDTSHGEKAKAAIPPAARPNAAPEPRKDAGDKESAHEGSIAAVRRKAALLPDNLRPVAMGIAASADNIVRCMTEDPRDREPGNHFLKRYLPAVLTVMDKYVSLVNEPIATAEIRETLYQSEAMLQRLAEAFSREHALLLENDVTDLAVQLKTLDTLLKMDGR